MPQVINNTTYQFKRGKQAAIERVNPVLAAGEPITVFCKDNITRLKIGDGVTPYLDLDFIGGSECSKEVLTYPTNLDFPQPPSEAQIDCIFKATNEAKLWQWNQSKFKYEILNDANVTLEIDDIDVINGGSISELLG